MKNLEDYQNSNWIERITKYEDVKEQKEYWQGEYERIEDNIIRRIIKLESQTNAILDVLKEINDKLAPKKSRNGSNSKKKTKVDKLVEENKKDEKKAKKRGRPRKVKGE